MNHLTALVKEGNTTRAPGACFRHHPSRQTGARRDMWALLRLIRASATFGVIVFSYLFQWALWRMFRRAGWVSRRWDRLHERNARRLYRGCVKLRGVYIKMGQVLSIMGSFLPRPYVRELEKLQDAVPPQPFRVIKKAVEAGLGRPLEEAFATFSEAPVAAASLGQVHEATTPDGLRVAVKVLYPRVATIIRVDVRVLRWAMWIYKRFVPVSQIDRVLDQLQDMLERETDFDNEAACLRRMAANFHDEPDILFPEVVDGLSSRTILTMTFMDGVKISRKDAIAELGLSPDDVAARLIKAFYKSVFAHRFFHADPHPGNFFVRRGDAGQAQIVVLDLGSASEVRDNLVAGMLQIMTGLMTRNDAFVLQGIETMGFMAVGGDRALLERTVRHYFAKLLDLKIEDFSQIDLATAERLVDPDVKRGELRALMKAVEYPMGWFYVERAAVILFGLCAQLAPRMNTLEVGIPFIMDFLAKNPLPVAPPRPAVTAPVAPPAPAALAQSVVVEEAPAR